METVTVDKKKIVWMGVFDRRFVEEAESSMGNSSEEEILHYCADIYATCVCGASWENLNTVLYCNVELEAAKKAKAFLQQEGE